MWDLLVLLAQIRGVALVLVLVAGGSGGFVSAAAGLVAAAQPAIGQFAAAVLLVVGVVAMLVSVATLRRWLRDPRVVRSGLLGDMAARLEGVRRDGDDLVAALPEPKGSQTFLGSRSKDVLGRIDHWRDRATDLVPPKHRPAWERIWSDTFGGALRSQSCDDPALTNGPATSGGSVVRSISLAPSGTKRHTAGGPDRPLSRVAGKAAMNRRTWNTVAVKC
jgi:hypothetical protein